MLFGVLDETENERRNTHYRVRFDALDRVPLKLRHAVADTYDSRAQLSDSKKVRKSGHKAFVDRRHQLHDIAWMYTGTLE